MHFNVQKSEVEWASIVFPFESCFAVAKKDSLAQKILNFPIHLSLHIQDNNSVNVSKTESETYQVKAEKFLF